MSRQQGATERQKQTIKSTVACPTKDTAPLESMHTPGASAAGMRWAPPSDMRTDCQKPAAEHGSMCHLCGDALKGNSHHAEHRTARHFRDHDRNGNPPSLSREPRKDHAPRREVAVRIGRQPPSAMMREFSLLGATNKRKPDDHKKFYPSHAYLKLSCGFTPDFNHRQGRPVHYRDIEPQAPCFL